MHDAGEITRDLQRTLFLGQALDLAFDELLAELMPHVPAARREETLHALLKTDRRRVMAVLHRHLALAWDDAERRAIDLHQQVELLTKRCERYREQLNDALRRISAGR